MSETTAKAKEAPVKLSAIDELEIIDKLTKLQRKIDKEDYAGSIPTILSIKKSYWDNMNTAQQNDLEAKAALCKEKLYPSS